MAVCAVVRRCVINGYVFHGVAFSAELIRSLFRGCEIIALQNACGRALRAHRERCR